MRRVLILWVLVGLVLAACGNDKKTSSTDSGDNLGLFDWSRDPNAIIVRLDSQPDQESPAFRLNTVPPCTLWGDGRVVWVSQNEASEEDVLEARIGDDAIRGFLEDIINRGFYDWDDELIPPGNSNPVIETITVSLYNEIHTVRRFSNWTQNGYGKILESCQQLSDTPVLVMPDAGWVSAYPVPRDTMAPNWLWPPDAPFTLKDLAANGESRWLTGNIATELWISARSARGDIQVLERDGGTYQVAIVVPGYSRDSAPAPSE